MRKLIFAIVICSLVFESASAQKKWTLRSVVDYAMQNNISVREADVQKRLSELTLNTSRLSRYPNAILSSDLGFGWGRTRDFATQLIVSQNSVSNSYTLSSNVDLFNWFSKNNTIKADEYDAEASRLNVQKVKNDIALNVAAAYLNVLVSSAQINLAQVTIAQTLAQLDLTRKQVEAGSLPELNAAQLESQLALDSSNLITAQSGYEQNLILLKAILNLDVATPFEIETPPVDQIPIDPIAELQPDYVYAMAIANLPQQKVSELRIKAATKRVEAARGAMFPSLSAGGNLNTQYFSLYREFNPATSTYDKVNYGRQLDLNFAQNVGVSLNIPIFNRGVLKNSFERSKLDVQSLELQRERDLYTIKQDIYTAYSTALAAMEKFKASQKAVEISERAYDYATKRYNIGLLNTADLLTSQTALFRARLDLISAQFDYVFKMKVLEFYKGQGIKL